MDEETRAEVVVFKNRFFIEVPNQLAGNIKLKDGEKLVFKDVNFFGFKVEILGRDLNLCQICQDKKAVHTCIACKKKVCSNHFWSIGGLCNECTTLKKGS